MVMAESMMPIAAGIAIGLAAALMLGHWIASILFGVSPRDSLTIGASASILTLTAAIAAFLPARRAGTIDPVVALRCE